MTLCKAVIMGTVVRNPEKRFTTNNVPITTFAMNISNDDEETLLRVIVMGKQAEVAAEKVTKDKTVIVEGRLQTGVAKSTSGEEKKIVEINAQSVEVIGSSVSTSSKNDNEEILKFQDEDFGDDLIGEDEIFLDEDIRQCFLINLPMKNICRDNCKGICNTCGQNLNEKQCKCKKEKIEKSFDVLTKLKIYKKCEMS